MPVKLEPFDVGDDVTVTLTFTDAADQSADPADLTVEVQSVADHAAGTVTRTLALADLTHAGTGEYTFLQRIADGPGLWHVKATATLSGGDQQIRERTIEVRAAQVP